MTAYVFLGPSLPLGRAREILDAVYLPPVQHGDVWRVAVAGEPSVIAIIDGHFEHVPAVWHKEILWALNQGIPVYGASSMGALRAAELAQFGMQGIGRVFEAYRDGVLAPFADEPFEDDDEVAVVHAPAEAGFVASEAMVNIRVTLARAAEERVISEATRDALVKVAKATFYKDRAFAAVLTGTEAAGSPAGEIARLRAWLPGGRVDQKRADAIQLLRHLATARLEPPDVPFHFEHTTMWDALVNGAAADADSDAVLTELRLAALPYLDARAAVLDQALDLREEADPPALSLPPDPHAAAARLDARARRLITETRALAAAQPLIDRMILRHLARAGADADWSERAARKRARLAQLGRDAPEVAETGLTPEALLAWYAGRLGGVDLSDAAATAEALGFASTLAFLDAVAGEYLVREGAEIEGGAGD